MKPLVSVIIPTHNRAALVQRAIESALTQSHDHIEVIVVDDGSTDRTAEQIHARFGPDGRFVLLRTANRGVAAARNAGLERATGSHVAFLDSDDEWFPWKIEFQMRCLDLVREAGMVWTDMAAVDANGNTVAPRYLRTLYRQYADVDLANVTDGSRHLERADADGGRLWHGDLYGAMLGGNLVHTSTVLMTADRLSHVRGFDEKLKGAGEDFDFHLRTCAVGIVAFADIPTIKYQVGAPDQLTRPDRMVQMARNYLTTIDKAIAADRGRTPEVALRRARARAQAWLGEELLEAGERSEATTHLRAAIRGARSLRTGALFLIAKLPVPVGVTVRRTLASLTRPFRRRSAG